jgi:hypothetical protein
VSLVLGATKHERNALIFRQAMGTAVWFTIFMLIVAAVLLVATWFI